MTTLVATFRTYLIAATTYRVNLVIWSLSTLLQVLVYLAVWQGVARAGGGSVGGLDTEAFASYFVVVLMVSQFGGGTMLPWMVPHHIQSGTLSTALVRPAHPLWYYVGAALAWKVQFACIMVAMAAVIAVTAGVRVDGSPADIAIAVPLVLLAAVQVHPLDATVACLAFHLVRIDGIRGIYGFVRTMLGGLFAPLVVFPDAVRAVAEILPFWWALGYPAQLISGGHDAAGSSPVRAFVTLGLWSIVSWLALQLAWSRGMQRYGAVGA